jgi:hypothetical protein
VSQILPHILSYTILLFCLTAVSVHFVCCLPAVCLPGCLPGCLLAVCLLSGTFCTSIFLYTLYN